MKIESSALRDGCVSFAAPLDDAGLDRNLPTGIIGGRTEARRQYDRHQGEGQKRSPRQVPIAARPQPGPATNHWRPFRLGALPTAYRSYGLQPQVGAACGRMQSIRLGMAGTSPAITGRGRASKGRSCVRARLAASVAPARGAGGGLAENVRGHRDALSIAIVVGWMGHGADAFAACSITRATSSGLEINTAWLPLISVTLAPARLYIERSRSGFISRSCVATMP